MQIRVSRSWNAAVAFSSCLALFAGLQAGCSEELTGPEPQVNTFDPSLVCNVQLTTEIAISGSSLSPLAIDAATGDPRVAIPDVTLTRIEDLDGNATSDGSVTIPNDPYAPDTARVRWISESEMAFEVYPELGLEPGLYQIRVTNRNGREAVIEQAITAVPKPSVFTAEPELICVEQGMRSVVLTGEAFVSVGADLPTVTIGGETFPVDSLDDCRSLPGPTTAEICTTATVVVTEGSLASGDHDIVLTNPDPAGCQSEDPLAIFVAAAPRIDSIEPASVCDINQPAEFIVTGQDFLRVDDGAGGLIDPVITVDGTVITPTWDAASCEPLASDVVSGQLCTSFSIPAPPGGFAAGTHDVIIENPAPADCSAISSFDIADVPIVTEVIPFAVCSEGDTFSVIGSGFVSGSQILVDGMLVDTTYVSDTELTGTIQDGFPSGIYDVQVSNGVGCESAPLASGIEVVDAPIIYFVDPPNVYSGIDMRITVWASGIYGTNPQVGIRPTGTTDPLIMLSNPDYDGQNRVQADLPAGLAAGDYDVIIIDDPCQAELQSVLHLTDIISVHVSGIGPLFGVEGQRAGITVRSDDPTPPGFANFAPTPRAYLNPVGGGVATEVQAVAYLGPRQLDGVVSDTLPPGEYEVVVVNPSGEVGVLTSPTYRVLPVNDPPPTITDLVPGLVNDSPAQNVIVRGLDFPGNAPDVSVTADCRDPRMINPDAMRTAVVNTTSATAIDTTWDMSGLSGYVCVVRVNNLANMTYADFSAVSVANASDNLNDFIPSVDMLEPRRAAAGAAIRLNAQSRFLFAIGGDLGDDGVSPVTRHSSVEYVPIDPFGALASTWQMQRNALPEERSFTHATVAGRHVYLAGGRVGPDPGTVDDKVMRAFLLDPFEAPRVRSIDLQPSEQAGLATGIWYYRVAAIMKPQNGADPMAPENNNPGGEGLPSEPLVVQLPFSALELSLFWNGIDGAERYVIYRTPAPDGIAGQEVFLAEIPHVGAATDIQSFTDDGTIDNSAETRTPLPLGSLGVWHQVATLGTEREGAAIVAAPDPVDPAIHYLYVIGGRDAAGGFVDSYEWATLTDVPGGNIQAVGTWQTGANTLPNGRWQHAAVYVDARRGPVASDQMWIYVLAGQGGSGTADNDAYAFQVDTADGAGNDDGALGAPSLASSTGPALGGYAYAAGNGFVHVIGGQSAQPSNGGRKAQFATESNLGPWSNGTNLLIKRYLLATARESAFIFLLGGQTDVEFATRQTERTNF